MSGPREVFIASLCSRNSSECGRIRNFERYWCHRLLREHGQFAVTEELDIFAVERGFDAAHVLVPLSLDLFDGADLFFESGDTAARDEKGRGMVLVFWRLENKMGERPPMQIIEVHIPIHARAAVA